MITFDQLLDVMLGDLEYEDGFDLQEHAHTVGRLMFEWREDNLSNSQTAEILNLDTSDPELSTVKTYLNSLTKADVLALEGALILAKASISATGITYDKAYLRSRFGLA